MQFSLSTFLPVSPEPASPGAPADAVAGQAAVDPTAVSFEEMLPAGNPPARPAAEEQGPESEMAASLLAASFWMPGMQLPPEAAPEPVTAGLVGGEAPAESPSEPPAARRSMFTFFSQGGPSVFSVTPTVRNFAPLESNPAAMAPTNPDTQSATPAPANAGAPAGVVALTRAGELPANISNAENPLTRTSTPTEKLGSGSATSAANAALLTAAGTNSSALPRPTAVAVEPAAAGTAPDPNVVEPLLTEVPGLVRPAGLPRSGRSFGEPASREYINGMAEKIAANPQAIPAGASLAGIAGKRDFLSTGHAAVSTASPSVGTDVAHVPFVMPAAPFTRSKTFPMGETVANVSVTVGTPPALNLLADLPAPLASLRETMAAVVTAVEALERRADLVQKSVDLQFQVGPERLALRVELRDGTVHTTFRTDSPELRTALAQEWQAIMPLTAGRDWRLADPVFNSTPTSGGESASSSLGQGAPHQRGQQTHEPAAFSPTPGYSDASVADSTTAVPSAPPATSLLQAFA